jgi:hypothetical protein
MHEAITYFGLDRLGLARPNKTMYGLIDKGALHPKKIAGRFAFDKKELDIVGANGDKNAEGDDRENFILHKSCMKENANKSIISGLDH